jgi:phosphatidylserine decarboxylase
MASAIAREGYPFLIFSLIGAIILYAVSTMAHGYWLIIWRTLSVIVFLFALFTAYFFRDPERTVPYDDTALLSPADGTIIDIREVEEPLYLKDKVKRVSIFMSPFNVHINRTPITGVIDFVHYHPGKFLSAFKEKASLDNESILVGFKAQRDSRRIAVKLIAGLIARRIVFNKKEGAAIRQGERIGMIRFGSRAELFCPLTTEIRVKNGDKVSGGLTVIGVIR